jgi:hypothetical protein
LQELRSSDSQQATAAAGLQQQLEQLLEQLLSLPDPLPALSNAAALAARTAGKVDAAGSSRIKLSHKPQHSACQLAACKQPFFSLTATSGAAL